MALFKNVMVLFFFFALIIEVSFGAVYEVGDSRGWINDSSVDYKSWASTKEFHVGDIIRFVYNPLENNVMSVTFKSFKSCNSTEPEFVRISGNDSFTITKPGHYYYICGVPGHCEIGQKVDIRVAKSSKLAPTPSPSPKLAPSPTPTSSPSPKFSPSPAPSLSPSPKLAPTPSPSSSPSPKLAPSPTPKSSPSPTPSSSPSPKLAPSPTPTSSPSPSPAPTEHQSPPGPPGDEGYPTPPAPTPAPSKKSSASSIQYFKELLAFQLMIAAGVLACFAF
uniref:Phytocyanin domain-containing protein n=1 Tax=Fagus sylvatica TaxID=28930 RepID=A0A2N9H0B5_FAGSY